MGVSSPTCFILNDTSKKRVCLVACTEKELPWSVHYIKKAKKGFEFRRFLSSLPQPSSYLKSRSQSPATAATLAIKLIPNFMKCVSRNFIFSISDEAGFSETFRLLNDPRSTILSRSPSLSIRAIYLAYTGPPR